MKRALSLCVAAALLHCGSAAPDLDALCSDAPPPSSISGNLVTTAGCPFEQQTDNILDFGERISTAGLPLQSASGPVDALVTHKCGNWLMGKDSANITIVIHAVTGEVRSHGEFHAGFPTTSLPAALSAPLSY